MGPGESLLATVTPESDTYTVDNIMSNARRFYSWMGCVHGRLRCEWVKDNALAFNLHSFAVNLCIEQGMNVNPLTPEPPWTAPPPLPPIGE